MIARGERFLPGGKGIALVARPIATWELRFGHAQRSVATSEFGDDESMGEPRDRDEPNDSAPPTRGAIVAIDALDDPRVADYASVRDRDLLGPTGRAGLFVGETRLVVDRMLERPGMTRSVFVEHRHAAAMREAMDRSGNGGVPLYAASESTMEAIAGFSVHRGVLAIGHRPDAASLELDRLPRDGSLRTVLVCEDITNIDNIGALYRNAAAFGVDAVVLSPSCHDHLYRKCLRVSLGHALAIPTVRSRAWPADLVRLRKEWGLHLIGLAIDGDARPIDEISVPERVAILVGSEFSGLSEQARHAADRLARIPMASGVDSLNVAVAAAIALHRFSRSMRMEVGPDRSAARRPPLSCPDS
jgi:tRNA G18 (ribose-2'-O)-methylase SpoU